LYRLQKEKIVELSRRDLSALLPALFAAQTNADSVLPSKCYEFAALPVKTNPETHTESRQVFRGETHGGFEVACHMTKLLPGATPHPPHKHLNEEIFFLREGTMELTIESKSCRVGPGSVVFVASNEMHGAKNVGDVPAQYFILELDGPK
jgi:mannose-6-phosphate isomerase-like protein (cupin superfamily)